MGLAVFKQRKCAALVARRLAMDQRQQDDLAGTSPVSRDGRIRRLHPRHLAIAVAYRGRAMTIYRLLRNAPLGETGHLIAAYELTLRALDVVDRNDPRALTIAKKVLEIGETGLKDPAEISKSAVKSLRFN